MQEALQEARRELNDAFQSLIEGCEYCGPVGSCEHLVPDDVAMEILADACGDLDILELL